MESNDLRVRNATSSCYGAQRRESVYYGVRKFVAGNFLASFHMNIPRCRQRTMNTHKNNPLELLGLDETVLVLVKESEGLPKTLSLQPFHQLSEFVICKLDEWGILPGTE